MRFAPARIALLFSCLIQPCFAKEPLWRDDAQELQRFQAADFFEVAGNSAFYQCNDALIKQKWTATFQSLRVKKGRNEIDVVSWHTRPASRGSKKIAVIRMNSYGFINRRQSGQARYSMSNAEVQAFGILKSVEEVEALEQRAARARGPKWAEYALSQKEDFTHFLKAAGFKALKVLVESDADPMNPSANGFLVVHLDTRSEANKLDIIKTFRGVGIRARYHHDDLDVPDTRTPAEMAAQTRNFLTTLASLMDPPGVVLDGGTVVEDELENLDSMDDVDVPVRFGKLRSHFGASIEHLQADRLRRGWMRLYQVGVKVRSAADAKRLGLKDCRGENYYVSTWNLSKIARQTLDDGVVYITLVN